MRIAKSFALVGILAVTLVGCSSGGPGSGTAATTTGGTVTGGTNTPPPPPPPVTTTPGGTETPAATGTPGDTGTPADTGTPGETGTPAGTATPSGTGTPGDLTATPAATGTPSAGAAGDAAEGFDKASSQPGYADVKKLGKNPVAGNADATAKGKELFVKNCASCHGESGTGDGPAAAALDPKPRNMTVKSEYKYGTGDLAIFRTIRYGVEGTGMAPWPPDKLSDEEVWQTVNYVKSLQK